MLLRSTFIALSLFSFFAGTSQLKGDAWAEVSTNKKGEVAIAYLEFSKYAYRNPETNEVEGICPEIMNHFAEYLMETRKIDITLSYVGDGKDFSKAFQSVKNGQGGVFGIGNISITEERKKDVTFTDSYLNSYIILITHSSVPTLTSKDDISRVFADFQAYSLPGTVVETEVLAFKKQYLPNLPVVSVESASMVATKVGSNPQSFSFVGMNFLLNSRHENIKYQRLADKEISGLGFMTPKGSEWAEIFNEFLAANGGYSDSQKFKDLLLKHLGPSGYRMMMSIGKS